MARLDNADVYNPFGPRIADLADPSTSPERREALREELLLWEAEEVAHGFRHLTIVHGDPVELGACRHLAAFYDRLRIVADRCGWVRVRGEFEFVTVTVRGVDAERRLAEFAAAADGFDPGDWVVTATAFPPLI